MRNLIVTTIFVVALTLLFTNYSEAVCTQIGGTPDGGNIINCPGPIQNTPLNLDTVPGTTQMSDIITVRGGGGINVPAGTAIAAEEGNNIITIEGGVVISPTRQAIETENGDDTITVNRGTLFADFQCIDAGGGDNVITVNGGMLTCRFEALEVGTGGTNILTVNGGTLISDRFAVLECSFGIDTVIVNGGTLDASSINNNSPIINTRQDDDIVELNGGIYLKGADEVVDLGTGNDTLKFGADIDFGADAFVDCGEDFDTLIFAMGVPVNQIPIVTEEIENLPSGDGSISINGITYEYINCEQFISEITEPVSMTIPTLSEWGMIALASALGVLGAFYAVRRRTAVDS